MKKFFKRFSIVLLAILALVALASCDSETYKESCETAGHVNPGINTYKEIDGKTYCGYICSRCNEFVEIREVRAFDKIKLFKKDGTEIKEDGSFPNNSGKPTEAKYDDGYETIIAAMAIINSKKEYSGAIIELPYNKTCYAGGAHVNVTRSVTIYGNNATVLQSSTNKTGESDLTIEQYADFAEDVIISIEDCKDLGVWGTRNTDKKLTLNINNATYERERIHINGSTGENYISIKNSKFDGLEYPATNCTIYSNAAGKLSVENCSFANISEPININTKATKGSVEINIKNCKFSDCGLGKEDNFDIQWAAPIRVLLTGSKDVKSSLLVDSCEFSYAEEKTDNADNGDILIGEGRENNNAFPLSVTVKNTKGELQKQYPSKDKKIVKLDGSELKFDYQN